MIASILERVYKRSDKDCRTLCGRGSHRRHSREMSVTKWKARKSVRNRLKRLINKELI